MSELQMKGKTWQGGNGNSQEQKWIGGFQYASQGAEKLEEDGGE